MLVLSSFWPPPFLAGRQSKRYRRQVLRATARYLGDRTHTLTSIVPCRSLSSTTPPSAASIQTHARPLPAIPAPTPEGRRERRERGGATLVLTYPSLLLLLFLPPSKCWPYAPAHIQTQRDQRRPRREARGNTSSTPHPPPFFLFVPPLLLLLVLPIILVPCLVRDSF